MFRRGCIVFNAILICFFSILIFFGKTLNYQTLTLLAKRILSVIKMADKLRLCANNAPKMYNLYFVLLDTYLSYIQIFPAL